MSTPIVGAGLYLQVITAAGFTCQCQGACGKKHKDNGGKCPQPHHDRPGRRLLAIPRDPTAPFVEAARMPARRLIAFCPACSDGVRRVVNRAVKAASAPTDGLFDAEPYTVTRSGGNTT